MDSKILLPLLALARAHLSIYSLVLGVCWGVGWEPGDRGCIEEAMGQGEE